MVYTIGLWFEWAEHAAQVWKVNNLYYQKVDTRYCAFADDAVAIYGKHIVVKDLNTK